MIDRIRRFDALDNFRDYGDYAAGSRHVAPGRLFRSGHQARATEADLASLAELGLGVVVDLRRASERRDQPSRRPAGWAGQVIEGIDDEPGEAPHIAFLRQGDLTVDSGRRFMTGVYREMPFSRRHVDVFSRYFRALGDVDGAVLIHCAAGKDRTGLLAALTHHVLGVHRDDLTADYMLTNQAVDLEARAPAIARQMEAAWGVRVAHDALVAFLGVDAAFLAAGLDAITARHGSMDAYLREALRVDDGLRDRIGERFWA